MSIGKLRDSSGDVNMDALLEKIQNFILRMDKDKYRPLNLESATDYLQVYTEGILHVCVYTMCGVLM